MNELPEGCKGMSDARLAIEYRALRKKAHEIAIHLDEKGWQLRYERDGIMGNISLLRFATYSFYRQVEEVL